MSLRHIIAGFLAIFAGTSLSLHFGSAKVILVCLCISITLSIYDIATTGRTK